uniref:Neur_chan_LBD domain-containing protein n=1 Tax=Macrostomum lignano TaxID=282301 RepID=A0A1I8F1H2_9PLAT
VKFINNNNPNFQIFAHQSKLQTNEFLSLSVVAARRMASVLLQPLLLLQSLLVLFLLLHSGGTAAKSSAENTKRVVDRILKNYTRQNSPNGDSTTNVYIGIYIIGFYSISEATMDYSLTIYLRQQWTDPRLKFNSSLVGGKTQIKLRTESGRKSGYRINEKKADFHSVTIPNRFMNLESSGRIWYVIKLSVTLSCEMDLKKYPLDTQMCPMMFESFGHTMDTVAFYWLQPPKRPDDRPDDLTMPQFDLREIHLKSCDLNYTTGAYPSRDFGYFLIQIYIPTMLIVILSWFAFWLNIDAVPARASGSKSSLPKVSYIKAIDVWMSACLGFVFASLLEFAVVNARQRRRGGGGGGGAPVAAADEPPRGPPFPAARSRAESLLRLLRPGVDFEVPGIMGEAVAAAAAASRTGGGDSPVFVRDPPAAMSPLQPPQQQEQHQQFHTELTVETSPQQPSPKPQLPSIAKRIDKFSRRFFPLTFLLFNVVYWRLRRARALFGFYILPPATLPPASTSCHRLLHPATGFYILPRLLHPATGFYILHRLLHILPPASTSWLLHPATATSCHRLLHPATGFYILPPASTHGFYILPPASTATASTSCHRLLHPATGFYILPPASTFCHLHTGFYILPPASTSCHRLLHPCSARRRHISRYQVSLSVVKTDDPPFAAGGAGSYSCTELLVMSNRTVGLADWLRARRLSLPLCIDAARRAVGRRGGALASAVTVAAAAAA